jgi:hypothetical protein
MLGCKHPHDVREKLRLEAIGLFVAGSSLIRFEAQDRQQLYGWVEREMMGQQYAELHRIMRFCGGNNSTALTA